MRRELGRLRVPTNTQFWELIDHPKAAIPVAEFVVKSGLLGQFHAVDPAATGVTKQRRAEDDERGED
ncbi:uncharacterized protein BDW47DRAFT_98388 [Aspergillus candidus]|uniref:Uncharacterized protein n=1 Tax=Aspergillus candidus TaxID=41067 RepID=A0A2I2FM47_ASPCN|nr:hypothetical protein BDW47DRAFT_98388 [Aspergillus candidus]PLB41693.1 hypothetical protein BDW47DRAFT_98388 [Aspergillus candidus]